MLDAAWRVLIEARMPLWDGYVHLLRAALFAITAAAGGNIGWGILLFSLAARLALLPLTLRAARLAQFQGEKLKGLQPKLAELRRRKAGAEVELRLMREAGVKPASGFAQILWQAPVFGGLYSAVRSGVAAGQRFLWIKDLALPDPLLALAAAALGALAALVGPPPHKVVQIALSAALTLLFVWRMSAGLGLYFAASGAVSVVQSRILRRSS